VTPKRDVVFRTPFFEIEARHQEGEAEPYYSLKLPDYVAVVAYDEQGRLVLVRQHRPAVDAVTLELPAGLVDEPGLDPEAIARRELEEETGYIADEMTHLGTLYSDTGRLQNRMWCYRARRLRTSPGWKPEAGVEPALMSAQELDAAIRDGRFKHALHLAVLELERHLTR
jgi:ADP-ribose pyrophosphatase